MALLAVHNRHRLRLVRQPIVEWRRSSEDPAALLDHVFSAWSSDPGAIAAEQRAAYLQALTPSTAAAICGDYRASFHLDREHDTEDRVAGRRIACPVRRNDAGR